MHGCRIQNTFPWTISSPARADIPIKPGAPLFPFFFRSILPRLAGHHWIVSADGLGGPWLLGSEERDGLDGTDDCPESDSPDDWEKHRLCDIGHEHSYFAPGLLPHFAPCVREDWNELFGFPDPVPDPGEWVRRRFLSAPQPHIAATATLCFLCVDGAYWEFFARDRELVDTVRRDLQGVRGIRIEDADFKASRAL